MPWQPQTTATTASYRPACRSSTVPTRTPTRAHRPSTCIHGDGWPSGHTGQTLLDLTIEHVQLPQRPAAAARGVVAVVGLADGPQAGLVREHQLRRRPRLDDLRRRQPGPLVAGDLRHGLHLLAGLQAAEPRPGPGRRGLLLAMAVVVAHRPGRVPVPLLHGPAVLPVSPGLLPGGAVARAVAPDVAAGPGRPRPRRCSSRPRCGCSSTRCAAWPGCTRRRLLRATRSAATGPATSASRARMLADRHRPRRGAGRAGAGAVAARAPPERRPGGPMVDRSSCSCPSASPACCCGGSARTVRATSSSRPPCRRTGSPWSCCRSWRCWRFVAPDGPQPAPIRAGRLRLRHRRRSWSCIRTSRPCRCRTRSSASTTRCCRPGSTASSSPSTCRSRTRSACFGPWSIAAGDVRPARGRVRRLGRLGAAGGRRLPPMAAACRSARRGRLRTTETSHGPRPRPSGRDASRRAGVGRRRRLRRPRRRHARTSPPN